MLFWYEKLRVGGLELSEEICVDSARVMNSSDLGRGLLCQYFKGRRTFLLFEMGSQLCSPGWPGTFHVT